MGGGGFGAERRVSLPLTDDISDLLRDIQKTCGLMTHAEVFDTAIIKLHDVVKIRRAGCVLVGVDEFGRVRHKMKDMNPDLRASSLMKRVTMFSLSRNADEKMAELKTRYGTQSDEPVLKLALENMGEMMEMRRAQLTIEGRLRDAKGATLFKINNAILNRAEESGRPLRNILSAFRLGGDAEPMV